MQLTGLIIITVIHYVAIDKFQTTTVGNTTVGMVSESTVSMTYSTTVTGK